MIKLKTFTAETQSARRKNNKYKNKYTKETLINSLIVIPAEAGIQ